MFKKCRFTIFMIVSITVFSLSLKRDASARNVKEILQEKSQIDIDAQKVWTLEDSVKRVIVVSPRIRAADAEIAARQGDLSQAGAWPNPDIGISVDDKLGIDDGSGGIDMTQIAINQSISLGRLSRQRKQAKARFEAAKQNLFFQRLLQEVETARRFHILQLMAAKLQIAEEQLEFSRRYQKDGSSDSQQKSDALVRYLSPLEQKRLDIMRASASQEVANVEGEHSEAVAGFNALLYLPQDGSYETAELKPIESVKSLKILLSLQEKNHPAIIAAQHEEEAANAGIALARGERLQDPTVSVFSERDFLNNERQNFFGVSLNFQLPLWDRKQGLVNKAKAEAEKVKYDQMALRQELQSQLRQTHLHLGHLIGQAEQYRTELLVSAKEVFELTQKSFEVGEVNVLSLVDANNTYFDARERYLELLYESRLEAAELRLAAGLSLMGTKDSIGGTL